GFHVIIIGHLGRKYRAQDEGGLQDEGLRVLADDQIAYEADAILLVEREGDERTVTPIIKPPRPAHLKFNKRYPATLATLYPDQVPDSEKASTRKSETAKNRKGSPSSTSEESEPIENIEDEALEPIAATPTESATTQPHQPPRDPAEAERRFFARYAEII